MVCPDLYIHTYNTTSEDAILTAAHCVEDRRFNRDSFHVIAGVLDLRWSGAITRKIKETHVHPKYEVRSGQIH